MDGVRAYINGGYNRLRAKGKWFVSGCGAIEGLDHSKAGKLLQY